MCECRGQILKFKRAVILVRNPFDAIWTELQRRLSNSHVGILTTDLFDVPESNCSTTTNNRPRKRMWDKIHAYLGMLSHYYEHMGIQNQYIIDVCINHVASDMILLYSLLIMCCIHVCRRYLLSIYTLCRMKL